MAQALAGVKILDLSRILTGPFATMLLADLGAEIIKVEPPGGDDTRQWGPPFINGESTYFLSVNRNKKSITLNLKHQAARQVLLELVRWADVLVENFRPGTLEKLGLGYLDRLRTVNPGLIYCAISGFGQTGPYRNKPGYDVLAQAMGGMMSVTGYPDGDPAKAGMSVADIGAGMFATVGILAALRHRDRTGEGQMVDASLLEAMAGWHTYLATAFWATGKVPGRIGTAHPSIAPYQAVQAQDGYVVIAVGNDELWRKFCQVMELPELLADPRFTTNQDRVVHRAECIAAITARFVTQPVAHWVAVLEQAGVPAGPILNIGQVWEDPHILARGNKVEVDHPVAGRVALPGTPVKLSATPGEVYSPPPLLGQHTDEVLRGLGHTEAEIAAWRAAGAL